MLTYLVWYLRIGLALLLVVAGPYAWGALRSRWSRTVVIGIRERGYPRRPPLTERLLRRLVLPLAGAVAIVVAWPVLLLMLLRSSTRAVPLAAKPVIHFRTSRKRWPSTRF